MKAIFIIARPPPSSYNLTKIQEQIIEEQHQHCDLLQADYIEHYNNLTLKELYSFQYLRKSFKSIEKLPEYIMKADDDVFINLPLLDNLLAKDSRLR